MRTIPRLIRASAIAVFATFILPGAEPPVASGAAPAPARPAAVPDVPSPTALLNRQLPGWIQFNGELRYREEGFLGLRFERGNDDMYLLQRVRLGVRLQPVSWLQFVAQAQDARVIDADRIPHLPPYQNRADLRVAYVQIGSGESAPALLRVGRQELAFGEERLVGAGNWGNLARSFDAVRLNLHRGIYRLDAFASSVVVGRDGELDHHVQGDNLHGLYGQIDGWIPKSKIEPYAFWRLARTARPEAGAVGRADTKTIGLRWYGELPQRVEYTTELNFQTGSWASDSVGAWAGLWRLGREFGSLPWKPRLRLELNYATGDRNPTDGKHGTFDVLYPTPHDKYGLADQVGWKNVKHIGLIWETKPKRSLIVQVKGHTWWLASARDGLYNAGGALLVRDLTGSSGTHVGEEIDFQAIWTPSNQVQVGVGLGHMFTGSYLDRTTPGAHYTFPYVSVTYKL